MTALNQITVPDIGDFKNVPIVQILVAVGDAVNVNDTLVTLESDKATIDIPSPSAGRVHSLQVAAGDRVSRGTLLLTLETESELVATAAEGAIGWARSSAPLPEVATQEVHELRAHRTDQLPGTERAQSVPESTDVSQNKGLPESVRGSIRAGPAVRALARRLGVNIASVRGSGPRARIVKEDVHAFVQTAMLDRDETNVSAAAHKTSSAAVSINFANFGPIERQPLSRIQKVSGARLARHWANIPHVTNFDEADVTDVESFRTRLNTEHGPKGPKLTMLAFLMKASAIALRKHARLNASLDGGDLVMKKYVNIGFAADTADGLLVPVVLDVDKKGLLEIARDVTTLASRARENKLKPSDMEGGSFTVSSLGGIGGTGFTPIINAPEVAILGSGKARMQPRWDGERFVPRLVVPLALSWDHRALDGAVAARFLTDLVSLLQDLKRTIL